MIYKDSFHHLTGLLPVNHLETRHLAKLLLFQSSRFRPLSSSSSDPKTSELKDGQSSLQVRQRVHRGESTIWTVMKLGSADAKADPAATAVSTSKRLPWSVTRHVITHDADQSDAFALSSSKSSTTQKNIPKSLLTTLLSRVREKLAIGFLPKGYPSSVTPDYTPYTVYSFLHSVSGTLTGTLSTQALLHALGMGAATSAGLAATTNWIIKDGFGLLGGVIYAGVTANRFDSSPKRYRFLSAVLIQVATLAELITPLFPHLFIPMASISNICKNIGWLASSATRASMHKGFSKHNNLGDVTAKAGAQSTAAGLIGTGGGIFLSWAFGTAPLQLISLFIPLTAANMWFAYRANEAVVTRTINLERCELIMHDRIRHLVSKESAGLPPLPTPESISAQEHFIYKYRSVFSIPLALEPSLHRRLTAMSTPSAWQSFLSGATLGSGGDKEQYRVLIAPSKASVASWKRFLPFLSAPTSPIGTHVCCWYTEQAKSADILKGFYHACVVRVLCEARNDMTEEERTSVVSEAYRIVEKSSENLMEELPRGGWDISHTHLGDRNARIALIRRTDV